MTSAAPESTPTPETPAPAAPTCVRVDYPLPSLPGVAEIKLCRPSALNAMNDRFFDELHAAVEQVDAEPAVRCVLLRGDGRCLTAGLDLRDPGVQRLLQGFVPTSSKSKSADAPSTGGDRADESLRFLTLLKRWQRALSALQRCSKPVIAAVHGACIGGGIDLITACDIRLCSADAVFCVAETRLAIVADLGTLARLPRIVGSAAAMELALTADRFDAARALQLGLVTAVLPTPEALVAHARAMAQRIAKLSPLAVQGTKKMIHYTAEHSVADSLAAVGLWNSSFLKSDDLPEAVAAQMQKRDAVFRDRARL